jgi:outer membrane beta-barrel protein
MRTHLVVLLLMLIAPLAAWAQGSGGTPLDANLAPQNEEEVSNVFRDMGVVQKRAMPKAGRWLLSTYGTLDFSDGPYSYYTLNVNPGYAISDMLEVYANFVPFYIIQPRSIVEKVAQLNGTISASRPNLQYGLEVLWAPLYGKDSLGVSRVIRSDTFLKFGASLISFEGGETGTIFKLGAGKTFFLTKAAGFRFCLSWGYGQQVVDNVKSFRTQFLTEFGMNFYL